MIRTYNLKVKAGDRVLLDNINLVIPRQSLTVIVGANGAGKTTLLKMFAGIKKPVTGTIINGAQQTFYLPQKIVYPEGITLYEYLSSIFFKSKWKWNLTAEERNSVFGVLDNLNLQDKKDLYLNQLSEGELQMANIGLGILSGADLLLLDEPTSNMDLCNQIKVLDTIKNQISKNITSLIILHDLNLAAKYGNFFIGLTQDKMAITGSKEDILRADKLSAIYGVNFTVINNETDTFVQICS